jgi:hypothetical protein
MTTPEPTTDMAKAILAVLDKRKMVSHEQLAQELGGFDAISAGMEQLLRNMEVGFIGRGFPAVIVARCPDCLDLRHGSALRRRWCKVRRATFGGPLGRPGYRDPLEKYSPPYDN